MDDGDAPAVLYFAGACQGSPGAGAAGFVISRGEDAVASGHAFVDEETTSSVADFRGLLMGLSMALDLGIMRIHVKGNSEVVVYTVRGVLRVGQEHHLMPDCERAHFLAKRFQSFDVERIARPLNAWASAEAKLGFLRELRDVNIVVARGGYDPLPWTGRGRGRKPRWRSDSLEIINPYSGARRPLPSMPKFKNPDHPDYDEDFGDLEVGVATLGDRVYFLGGECVSRCYPGGVRSLDIRTGKWRRHASLPDSENPEYAMSLCAGARFAGGSFCKRTGCAVVATAGKIYQIGGKVVDDSCGDAHASHHTDVYDPNIDTWAIGPRTAAPRMHASAVVCDGYVIVCGGTGSVIVELDGFENYGPNQQIAVDTVEVLDVYRQPLTWLSVAPLPERLAGVVLISYDGAVYALGGQAIEYDSPAKGATCRTRCVRTVYVLDIAAGPERAVWETLPKLPMATAYGTVIDLGSGHFCISSAGHVDLIVAVGRCSAHGGQFQCAVVREGWPCDVKRSAFFNRSASGVCLGAERDSQASLGAVDPTRLSGCSHFLV